MSQVGKLYQFYFKKIWTKNWLRIIIFTLLISVVWWFVIPWVAQKSAKMMLFNAFEATEQDKEEVEKELPFKEICEYLAGGKDNNNFRIKLREKLEKLEKKLEEGDEEVKNLSLKKRFYIQVFYFLDHGSLGPLNTPFSTDNAFFFQKTECKYTEGKQFWKMLFEISWWNLSGVVLLYWFIFEVFDKTFFPSRREGEEATVLTVTPGVKRSDIIWGKILAFLTFYFLINIVLFLIPFSIYYFWLGEFSFAWFASLALITIIVGPFLYFCLIFVPYLFFSSLTGQGWIFSTLVSFFPLLWIGVKTISSSSWPYTLEKIFFDPLWFTIISLVCGVFFLTLYYLRYQEEDLA